MYRKAPEIPRGQAIAFGVRHRKAYMNKRSQQKSAVPKSSKRKQAAPRQTLTAALDAGPRRQRLPAVMAALMKDWDELKAIIVANDLAGEASQRSIAHLDLELRRQCWAWRAEGKMVRFAEVDRLGQHYCGPMYTCKGYGWPMTPAGYPCLPLVQLDLKKASDICGVELGDGLLQLFETCDYNSPKGSEGYFLRTIPGHRVSQTEMSPLPRWTEAKVHKLRMLETYSYDHELAPDYPCFQISAFSKKQFLYFGPEYELLDYTWEVADKAEKELEGARLKRFKELYAQLGDRIGSLLAIMAKQRGGTHLFGSFYSIQYSAAEVPIPLFCIHKGRDDSSREPFSNRRLSGRFELGDSGNGQILIYRDKRGKPCFRFRWTCY